MIYVYNLILEVTRKCQLSCIHCLRGDTQKKSMTRELIDKVSELFTVNSLCLSGGEVSLNMSMIEYTLRTIDISFLDITTNGIMGKNKLKRFHDTLLEAYASGVDMSIRFSYDDYHFDGYNIEQEHLANKAFEYFDSRGILPCRRYSVKDKLLIGDGNAFINQLSFDLKSAIPLKYSGMQNIAKTIDTDCEVYISCEGDVFASCNLSYKSMEVYKRDKNPVYYGNIFEDSFLKEFDERLSSQQYSEDKDILFTGWNGEDSYEESMYY